ncbi:MAG: flagellar biosynthesis protein FlhF [Desulfovibrio desulfuricans]|jgi:flagellar biosynthesis protein FlhF|uniref:flagellar biosynthesis protein FlhF n=1 Tax=uncultured Desulfovibrio sp. TaxID=167968 RepID=UPI001B17A720|nr:flagellar biosynthesis protein FlhF [uncultured Desulfovibrio sp.]MBE6442050.1 flagellar biosynthesis protein FlhF [Desulfovibrio desulfuricans]MBO5491092.1 flagellar biosynthesis protein FlhF [Desulfovibrio sp.]
MQVKTFTGASSQEILARIKAEMGPEAVILGNRTYRKNGTVCHEITAGLERPGAEAAAPAGASSSEWGEWHKEWMQIKGQIFALMKPAIQLERLTPRQRVALEYLQREGVSDAVAVGLYQRLLAEPGSSVLECLCGMVPVKAWGTENWGQRIHLMVGPFGFGKTTTALRFALHLRRHEPEARIAFINADCLRGNGRLVLRHWAELSNFTYMEAPDKAAMERALTAVQEADAVFVDVPGLGRDGTLEQWRADMGLDAVEAATHLTLSPFFDALQTQAFLQRYKTEGPGSIVWTKLDEAVSFGSIVNVACAAGLPVSALSYGAELKESLAPATEPLVWRLIFKRQLPGQAA